MEVVERGGAVKQCFAFCLPGVAVPALKVAVWAAVLAVAGGCVSCCLVAQARGGGSDGLLCLGSCRVHLFASEHLAGRAVPSGPEPCQEAVVWKDSACWGGLCAGLAGQSAQCRISGTRLSIPVGHSYFLLHFE